eukprot:TRINITY_DN7491_c0_g1_i1.p2 TRINITY_DN7491_c0_g1~~TRINITY_DN7491_c0_g1_i1.p2  ORF type:complete len:214 (+),score=-31.29 TRINITY_DN7491_c0_g1_i1:3-644(+)
MRTNQDSNGWPDFRRHTFAQTKTRGRAKSECYDGRKGMQESGPVKSRPRGSMEIFRAHIRVRFRCFAPALFLVFALLTPNVLCLLPLLQGNNAITCGMPCCKRKGACCCHKSAPTRVPSESALRAPSSCGPNCARLPITQSPLAIAIGAMRVRLFSPEPRHLLPPRDRCLPRGAAAERFQRPPPLSQRAPSQVPYKRFRSRAVRGVSRRKESL